MSEVQNKFIDVKKVIGDKNPKLLKRLPNFLINYLKKILHEDEINDFIELHKNATGHEFAVKVLEYFNIKVNVHGLENVPKNGKVILACNHPLGGMDAMALIQTIQPYRQDYKFVVNDILLALKSLSTLFVGVNKHGKNSADALHEMNGIFNSGQAVFVFPAGLVSRKKGGNVQDLEWKKTFVTRSKKFEIPVVPVYVDGSLSNFFYRLSNVRSTLGIKANIEMLYLADEQFKLRNQEINIYFGQKLEPTVFDSGKSDIKWAEWVKNLVYQLK